MSDGDHPQRVMGMLELVTPPGKEFNTLMDAFQYYVSELGYPHRRITRSERVEMATIDLDDASQEGRYFELRNTQAMSDALEDTFLAWVYSLSDALNDCPVGYGAWSVRMIDVRDADIHLPDATWGGLNQRDLRFLEEYTRAFAPWLAAREMSYLLED